MIATINLLIHRIGSLVCHQSPTRTILVNNIPLPLCARCTGIYLGFLIGTLYQFILWRCHLKKLPVLKISILSIILLIALILESIGSYFGFWTSHQNIRLILGLLGGSSISLFLIPIFNFTLFIKETKQKEVGLSEWKEYIQLTLILGLISFLITSGINKLILYYIFAILSVFGSILLCYIIAITIIFRVHQIFYEHLTQRRDNAVR
ncbi:MAG: DUF2085 domain-containing protein [Elusimicrobia bacterium]|nr:DUF2085 domain-containing protein [Elusimicrobiota bacterium]